MKTENNGSREIPYLSVLNEKMGAYLGWFYAYTFAVWALMVAQFLTNGEVVLHAGMIGVYITFLTAYTGQKELTRWSLDKNYRRIWGELWVYVWLATGLVLWPLASIFPKTFQCAPSAELAANFPNLPIKYKGSIKKRQVVRNIVRFYPPNPSSDRLGAFLF